MESLKMLKTLRKFCRLQIRRNLHFHTSSSTRKTWSHFQFLKATRNSSLKTPEKLPKTVDSLRTPKVVLASPLPLSSSLPPNLSPPQPSRIPRSRVFYSTCSDKPPKKPDCSSKPKKCPEESTCSEKSFENFCPNYNDQTSCSTNKPQCPEKCQESPKPKPKPKPKPCPPPEDRSVCVKPKPKPKACSQSEDRSVCSKPRPKPSGCGGGKKPPPCSRSYSSCAAEATDKTPDLTFGERQRRKIAEFCSRRKMSGTKESEIVGKAGGEECEKDESPGDRLKREKEEMAECLKRKIKFSELGYTRVHCKECIRDIISRDAKRFLRELDPYGGILRQKVGKVSCKHEERAQRRKNNWIESILTRHNN